MYGEDMLKDVEVLDETEEEAEGSLTVSDNFGIMLKHYRKLKNLSLKQLEEISGVSASYVNRLERGERKSPSITKILQLAEALEIPNSVLVATIIQEPRKNEKVDLSELLIKHEYLLKGGTLSRDAGSVPSSGGNSTIETEIDITSVMLPLQSAVETFVRSIEPWIPN